MAVIPKVDRSAILAALADFDRDLRETDTFKDWEHNQAHKYAISYNGKQYPVKKIVSAATGNPVLDFSGGKGAGQVNQYVQGLGFEIVELRKRNPKWTRDELILALDFYLQHSPNPPGKDSPDIRDLSATLNRLARVLGISREAGFRNENGVYMKMMNFRRFDPTFVDQGKIGLTRGWEGRSIRLEGFRRIPSTLSRCGDGHPSQSDG